MCSHIFYTPFLSIRPNTAEWTYVSANMSPQ